MRHFFLVVSHFDSLPELIQMKKIIWSVVYVVYPVDGMGLFYMYILSIYTLTVLDYQQYLN